MTMDRFSQALAQRVCRIRLIASDVDGVMTDGRLYYDAHGEQLKVFQVQDGHAIKHWLSSPNQHFAIISGRQSAVTARRCAELGIAHCHLGVDHKLSVCQKICDQLGISLDEVAYIGDDHPDRELIRAAGFGVAVPNARPDVRADADWIPPSLGGHGVIADLVELINRFRP